MPSRRLPGGPRQRRNCRERARKSGEESTVDNSNPTNECMRFVFVSSSAPWCDARTARTGSGCIRRSAVRARVCNSPPLCIALNAFVDYDDVLVFESIVFRCWGKKNFNSEWYSMTLFLHRTLHVVLHAVHRFFRFFFSRRVPFFRSPPPSMIRRPGRHTMSARDGIVAPADRSFRTTSSLPASAAFLGTTTPEKQIDISREPFNTSPPAAPPYIHMSSPRCSRQRRGAVTCACRVHIAPPQVIVISKCFYTTRTSF